MSHIEYTLAGNSSVWGLVEWNSDPGIRVVVPEPMHAEIGHEHQFEYTRAQIKRYADGRWEYWIFVTNLDLKAAHFKIRWSKRLD